MEEEGRAGETLSKSVRHVERSCSLDHNKDSVAHQVPHKVPPHVDVTRELAVDLVVRNCDARRVVLPHHRGLGLLISKSSQHRTEVYNLLTSHAGGDILRLCGAQRHTILTLRLPRNRLAI
eukprot:848464-Rhodomonas_salina.4